MTATTITAEDEALHPVGEGEHWQESYYFNWADTRHDAFGLTRIGYRFGQQQIDGLILTIRQGRPEYIYPAVNIRDKNLPAGQDPYRGLQARKLTYVMEKPLQRWSLQLSGRDTMNLTWEAFTPAFNYQDSERELPPNVAGHHFEQSGKITGQTRFKGRTLDIDGVGQRDKSWGVRDWANVEGWDWISVQFGEDLTFNVWEGWFGGRQYQNGFVFREGINHPVRRLKLQYHWSRKLHVPETVHLAIDAGTPQLEVTATTLGWFPLIKKGLWIQEIHTAVEANLNGQTRRGIGVVEHAWRVSRRQLTASVPGLIKVAAQTLGGRA